MSEVFIAYSRKDVATASALAEHLRNLGFDVFYDLQIAAGSVWRDSIEAALNRASVVIVLWSEASVQSEWVRAEADMALRANKLLPVLIERIEIPLGFSHIQTLNLAVPGMNSPTGTGDWKLNRLVDAVEHFTKAGHHRNHIESHPDTPGDRVVSEGGRQYKRLKRARGIHLFIAHASADKPKLRPVVEVLIDSGFRVWIDKPQEVGLAASHESRLARDRIVFGNDWKEAIRLAVNRANVVLAFWSRDAVNGRREQFHYEVYLGMMQGKLNQCRIDEVEIEEIGMPYTFDHIANLAEINTSEYHPELDYLMQDICERAKLSWWRAWSL